MSSVTFLVSAVLTVCVLNAVDRNGASVSSEKIDYSAQVQIDLNKPARGADKLNKPQATEVSAPNASVYGGKKIEQFTPASQDASKIVASKNANAI